MAARFAGINPSLLAVIGEGFLSRLSFGLVSFALPLYALRLGLSIAEIGFLISLSAIVAVACKTFIGRAVDRLGMTRSLTGAIALRSAVTLLLAFAPVPWQLFAIRGAQGVAESVRVPAASVLLAEHGGKKGVASAFAWYGTAKSIAGSLGKALAGVLLTLTAANYSLVFLVAFALSILPLLLVACYVKDLRKDSVAEANEAAALRAAAEFAETKVEASSAAASDLKVPTQRKAPRLLPFIGFGFLISGTTKMLHGLFPVLAVQYAGLNEAQTGLIYLLSTLVVMIAGPLFGWISDNVSRKLVLMVRAAANIVSSAVYLLAPNFAGIASGKVVDDVGKAAFNPAWGALMAHVASFDPESKARTMSLLSMGDDAGEIAGPIVTGLMWTAWGLPAVLGVRIALSVITEIYALVIARTLPVEQARPSLRARLT